MQLYALINSNMDNRLHLPTENPVCIIINNTCNLTCNACGTLQNYNFAGVMSWKEEKHLYEEWAKKANFPEIDILGGEPYLNPELLDWALGIKSLWPDSQVNVVTNGTLLGLKKNVETTRTFLEAGVCLNLSGHDQKDIPKFKMFIDKILEPFGDRAERINPDYDDPYGFEHLDMWQIDGKYAIGHTIVDKMFPNYVKEVKDNTIILDDGDREESHDACLYGQHCHTLQRGKLFKCPLVLNYDELKTQTYYEERAYPLLEDYKPLTVDQDKETMQDFFNNIGKSIPACSLCAMHKKPKPKELSVDVQFDKNRKKAFKGVDLVKVKNLTS